MSTPPAEHPITRVVVVSEIRLYREGLVLALDRQAGIQAVSTSTAELPATLMRSAPNVVLADCAVVRAAALATQQVVKGTAVVAFGVAENDEAEVFECVAMGVTGLIARDARLEDVAGAALAAARGEFPCSPTLVGVLARCLRRRAPPLVRYTEHVRLTPREEEIIALINDGLSNKEIARRLRIVEATVKNHVHHVLEKMHVHRRGEAAAALRSMTPSAPSSSIAAPRI